MALGAQNTDIARLILGHGLRLAAAGVLIGLVGAYAVARLLTSLLYDTATTDPVAYAATALILSAATLLACYLPARRATRVDPMIALRCE
jgi:ABC-type antimicrobial peptide transport system permease subunit